MVSKDGFVGRFSCYWNKKRLGNDDLSGASVEPRGPGDNGQSGVNNARRIEEGIYQLGTHGWVSSKYQTTD